MMATHSVLYICFDPIPAPKGASTHVTAFVEALSHEYAVTLLSIGLDAHDGHYAGARHLTAPATEDNYLDRALAYREVIWDTLERGQYDVVHFRTMWAAMPVAAEQPRQGYRVVCEVNGIESIELKYHYPGLRAAPEVLDKLRQQEQASFVIADALITPSAVTKKYLLRHGVPEERVTVIPNGVDVTLFTPGSAVIRDHLDILYVGTLAPWQGMDVLLDAFHQVASHFPLRLRLLSPPSRKWGHAVRKLIRKYRLEEVVEFLPPVPHAEVPTVIQQADICVAPLAPTERNLIQGCQPIKLLEYMACGKAVVAADLPVVREVLAHEDTALLYKISKPARLAECLARLAEDATLRQQLGTRALTVARERFTWAQSQQQLRDLYAEVLARTSA